jgi:hypothetical protein
VYCKTSLWVRSASLPKNTTSCGCYVRDVNRKRLTTHGQTGGYKGPPTRAYRAWRDMIDRCTNPNNTAYANYGGRGITIEDPRWFQFENFFADMGVCPPGLTIGRLDNARGYCKSNCEWQTIHQQVRNRRNYHVVEYQHGRTMTLAEACELAGVDSRFIEARIKLWRCSFTEAIAKVLSVKTSWTAATYRKKLGAFLDEIEKNPDGTYGVFIRQEDQTQIANARSKRLRVASNQLALKLEADCQHPMEAES